MWNELTFLWNELTILWNDLTTDWNDLTWNDLTMARNDRIPKQDNCAFVIGLRVAATFADEISTTSAKIQLGVRSRNDVSLICSL